MSAPLERDDLRFAKLLSAMDRLRAGLRETREDPEKLAEIELWFRENAPAIRRLRDRLEPEW